MIGIAAIAKISAVWPLTLFTRLRFNDDMV
jgi:hypothetical protein